MTAAELVTALFVTENVLLLVFAFILWKRLKPMPDFTALQSSISTLSTVTSDLSAQIANSTDAAVQSQIDSVTSSLAPLVSTLSGLVSTPSTVSTVEG